MGECESKKSWSSRKKNMLINSTGKYPDYNFYRVAGLAIGGKDKGDAENEAPPVDLHQPIALNSETESGSTGDAMENAFYLSWVRHRCYADGHHDWARLIRCFI